jgi:hypothetical protein
VEYESACRALAECATIDEAKYFADKAEALAVWAKIYKDNVASENAKRLRLHAFRRISALASEIQPRRFLGRERSKKTGRLVTGGSTPGPNALIKSYGFSANIATLIRRIGKIDSGKFEAIVAAAPVPSIQTIKRDMQACSESWRLIVKNGSMNGFRSFCRANPAKTLAAGIAPGELTQARAHALELLAWLDEFEQRLSKGGILGSLGAV